MHRDGFDHLLLLVNAANQYVRHLLWAKQMLLDELRNLLFDLLGLRDDAFFVRAVRRARQNGLRCLCSEQQWPLMARTAVK